MAQNQALENAKSLPCMELLPLVLEKSDHSIASYKSCNVEVADANRTEIGKPVVDNRPSVKALVEKHRLIQDKLCNAKIANLNVNKKSLITACNNLKTSYSECCKNMEGDMGRMDKVENFVKNQVFEIFTAKTYESNQTTETDKSTQIDNLLNKKNFDIKTGTPELDETVNDMGKYLWQNIISLVNINRDYYRCLMQIMKTNKFKNINDVKVSADLVLKQGKMAESIGSHLIAVCQTNLNKIGQVVDNKNKLSVELMKDPLLIYHSKLDTLQTEVTENKKSLKNAEIKIALLEREKRDLLNILNSYDTEDVHKVSLEKRLQAEQQNNDQLRDMINLVFQKKVPFYNNFNRQ